MYQLSSPAVQRDRRKDNAHMRLFSRLVGPRFRLGMVGLATLLLVGVWS